MVERTVYVGSTVQVIVRLATGQPIQAAVTNAGTAGDHRQGTAVLVRVAPDALRVLGVPDGGGDGSASDESGPEVLTVGGARA
jgi:hypothetical protein